MCAPLVSIIVPFYNPGEYFRPFLESVAEQSYENIEIILVDDGSEHAYNRVATNFVKEGERRLLLTKDNGGVSSARQAGLDLASGEFVIHADSDDLLPKRAIELLVTIAQENDSDIVVGAYIVKRRRREYLVEAPQSIDSHDFLIGMLLGRYHGSLCNKLIKRKLYEGLHFDEMVSYLEDKLILSHMFFENECKISFLHEPVYVYRQHAGSTTSQLSWDSIKSAGIVTNNIADIFRGSLEASVINLMIKNNRVFEILQSARKGVNIFSHSDVALLRDRDIGFKKKIPLWMIRLNLIFIFRSLVVARDFSIGA